MIHGSPLPALIEYYRRLADEDVAAFGFSRQKISFRVVLERDGRLSAIEDARQPSGKRMAPTMMIVAGQSKPSGQGINPCFMWDNAQYMLGVKQDDPSPQRTARAFAAFRDRHVALADEIKDEPFAAVCAFLKQWDPKQIETVEGHELLEELGGGFGVFQIRGEPGYVHEREAVRAYWERQVAPENRRDEADVVGQSLISGRVAPLARLHEPKIKGVVGGQSSGGVLIGFNDDAYTSYGKTQSYNAPVAEDEAFEYATALNRLLYSDSHRARLGDTTVVFWSGRPTQFESLLSSLLGGDAPTGDEAEDAATTQRVRTFLDALRRGAPHEGIDDADAPFYILGLAPNAARISIRYWLAGTVGTFADRLAQHVRDLEMVGARDEKPPTIRRLLRETAREAKDIPPQLAGEVARAVLAGAAYPSMLYTAVLRRVRADQTMNHPRAAILKACLTRNHRMEVPVALNKDHPDPAYHMGRLFAALEKTQEDTVRPTSTIKDGYFATASATPGSVFPRLIRMHQHHIEKLEGGHKVNREKLIQEICSHVAQFPPTLPLEQQGLFQIGYYHQRQDLFTKRESSEPATETEETADV